MKNMLILCFLCTTTHLLAGDPDSASFYFRKGLEEKNTGRLLAASQAFEKALQFNDKFLEACLENGFTCLSMKKMDKAKIYFTKANEINPANQAAIRELASLYFNYRQFEKAIAYARKCFNCPGADRIIGVSYYQIEDYPSAEKFLRKYLSANPDDAEAVYTLARTYLDMEEYRKSLPVYEKAVSMDKTKNSWMYELGLLYYTLNEYKSAMRSFISAAENGYPQSNDYKENLGYTCLYSGEYDRGEQLLMEVWNRKPGNRDILRDLAEILYKQNQFDRSLAYCQKLMELDGRDGKALYQAGLNFQKKGQKTRGEQMCDKAIEIDPSLASLRQKKEIPGM